MRDLILARVVGMALVTASLLTHAGASAAIGDASTRKTAPDFSLIDANGKQVTLSRLKGRVVLLDFWATWCAGCKEEMPWFVEFQTRYGKQGLASVGVALDEEGWAKVRPYLAEHPINYPIVVADAPFANRYGVTAALPVTVLIDRVGRIAEVHVGKVDKNAFEADIRQLLREKSTK